jgi:hypothetical protein
VRLAWPRGKPPLDPFALSDADLHVQAYEHVVRLGLPDEIVETAGVEAVRAIVTARASGNDRAWRTLDDFERLVMPDALLLLSRDSGTRPRMPARGGGECCVRLK